MHGRGRDMTNGTNLSLPAARGPLVDVAVPLVLFYGLRAVGVGEMPALIVGMIAYNAGLSQGLAQTAVGVGRGAGGPGMHAAGFGIFGFFGFIFKVLFFGALIARRHGG